MLLKSIASRIKEAERQNKKTAMFHFQILIHAEELRGENALEFCREVGMKDSFATDFKKLMSLSQMMKDEGYVLRKA